MKATARTTVMAILLAFATHQGAADEAGRQEPLRKPVKLPGLIIDFEKRCVDIEATVCLDEGYLELVACTQGTKEHESIVAVEARPMHIHTALLLLGANNGNPAMRKQVGDEETRWVDIPPRGDLVDVYLVFGNADEKVVEHSISDFVARSKEHPDVLVDAEKGNSQQRDKKFPKTFLFTGSHLVEDGPGPRTYLADQSGNVISIATFGDELLCLSGLHAEANDALMWQIDATKLPKVGAKVTLRLRPRNKAATRADEAEKQLPKNLSQPGQK